MTEDERVQQAIERRLRHARREREVSKVSYSPDGFTIYWGSGATAWDPILERDPAGSMFRPWNTPETLAKVPPLVESPWRCASTRPTPKPGT